MDDLADKDVTPVGQEYIEEVKNEWGKVVSFNCKLCECKFNDPNAKEMHMKGRRHRLQYKVKMATECPNELKICVILYNGNWFVNNMYMYISTITYIICILV